MKKTLIAFVLGVLVGGAAIWWYLFWLQGEWAEREVFIQPTAAVSESVMALELLQAGKMGAAIEQLEISLDGGLVGLSVYRPDEFSSAQHELIRATLTRAKEYRSSHPRTNGNPEVATAIAKALSQAD
jgi:hypothetical protein